MQITRTSIFFGVTRTREIDITPEQYDAWARRGQLIQDAMPHLSADDREFLLTGATPEEWAEVFGQSEDEADLEGVIPWHPDAPGLEEGEEE